MNTTKNSVSQLDLFEQGLPEKPYCAHELGNTLIRPKTMAVKMAYIQANQPNSLSTIIFDVDRSTAIFDWEDRGCPPPNYTAMTRSNGHAHLGYILEDPVHLNHNSRKNPIRYAAAVEAALRKKLDADPCYVGPLTKNPLRKDRWFVTTYQPWAYSLGWLADWLDLEPYEDQRKHLPPEGFGRNCTLFDVTRLWAYKERRKLQAYFGYEFWYYMVEAYTQAHNTFPMPLTTSEVKGIAKSIAKWVWTNMSPEGFKAWADNRRAKSLEIRQAKAAETRTAIIATREAFPTATIRKIAEITGVPRNTVHRLLSHL